MSDPLEDRRQLLARLQLHVGLPPFARPADGTPDLLDLRRRLQDADGIDLDAEEDLDGAPDLDLVRVAGHLEREDVLRLPQGGRLLGDDGLQENRLGGLHPSTSVTVLRACSVRMTRPRLERGVGVETESVLDEEAGLFRAAFASFSFSRRSRRRALPVMPSLAIVAARSFVRCVGRSRLSRRKSWFSRSFSERTQRRAAFFVATLTLRS